MIKLIVTDMDGTLLNSEKHLPPDFYAIMQALQQKGVTFCIGTGRTWKTLQSNFAGHLHELDFICENGAFVVEKEKQTFASVISPQLVQQVVMQALQVMTNDVNIMLCGKNGAQLTPYAHNAKLNALLAMSVKGQIVVPDITKVQDDIFKIAIADLRGPQSLLLPLMQEKFGNELQIIQSGPYFMDCMNVGVSKGAAVAHIQKSMGISPQETMVFGDYFNDVTMLQQAKYSFVMGNAPKEMFAHGNYKAKTNDEDGVMEVVRKYVLQGNPLP